MVPQIWRAQKTEFLSFFPSNLENKNFEKMKKAPGDIISLHMCTINENHVYGSWDIECNRQNFFVILDHFFLFNPPNKPENQNLEKWKKPWDIIILHLCIYHKWCMVLEIRSATDKNLLFCNIFCPFTPLTTQKIKIFKKKKKNEKNKKKTWRYYHAQVHHKWKSYDV